MYLKVLWSSSFTRRNKVTFHRVQGVDSSEGRRAKGNMIAIIFNIWHLRHTQLQLSELYQPKVVKGGGLHHAWRKDSG